MYVRRAIALAVGLSLLLSIGSVEARQSTPTGDRAAGRYLVLLRDGVDVDGLTARYAWQLGVRATHAYRHAVRGFAASLNAHQLSALRVDPAVALIEADRVVQLEAQILPTGIDRVDADLSPTAKIDGLDERVDADIAIIDTGIQADHPDLNVAGGHNCINANPADWGDGYGHGTHVAGIAAAKDNLVGVVGVAPGARLWAVRVFDSTGFSLLSWIVCGIDWVTGQKDPTDSTKPLFEAANMSLRDAGSDDGNCGYTNGDAEHQAICRSVAAGITYAVAAGNDRTDASQWIPAAYPEVITVSALADFNGKPGGGAPSTCSSFSSADVDDTFADFSNYGAAVDLIAPGKCIYSTYPTTLRDLSGYVVLSGTSMATPHVAGAIALYKVSHPAATPAEVQTALRAAGTLDWFTNTDPDGIHEPLLNVSTFGAPPDFTLSASPSSQTVTPGASTSYTITITITPSGGFSGLVDLSVNGLPGGVTGSFNPPSVTSSSTLAVTTNSTTLTGSYPLTITGTSGSPAFTRTTSATLLVIAPATPDFTLSASPTKRSLPRGGSTSYAITITPSGGFSGSVSLGVSGLPIGATGSFSTNPATSSSTLTVTTSSSTRKSTYALAITGTSSTLTRTTSVTLRVQ